MRGTARLILAALVAATLVACGGGGQEGGSGGGSPTGGGSGGLTIDGIAANDHGSKDISGSSSVDLEADDFYFAPTVLEGSPGQTVTIEVENEGSAEHNLTIESLGVDQDVEPGERADVRITLPDSGTVTFFCKYHQRSGMVGEITVA